MTEKTTSILSDDQARLLLSLAERSIINKPVAEFCHIISTGGLILRLGDLSKVSEKRIVGEWDLHFVEVKWEVLDEHGSHLLDRDNEGARGDDITRKVGGSVVAHAEFALSSVDIRLSSGLTLRAALTPTQEDDDFCLFMISYQARWMIGFNDCGSWVVST